MTNAVSLAQQASTGVSQGFKNRIINGAMRIDQRNSGSSFSTISDGGTYTLDRWQAYSSPTNKYTVQQNAGSVTPPAGFNNYLGVTSSSSYSSSANDYFGIDQIIEGFNMADFGYGSSNAKTVTLSFWVRSSLTGTFSGALRNGGINDYSYVFTYTISAANTWEYKTITITGATAGTWLTTNGQGLWVWFDLGTGSSQTTSTVNAWQNANNLRATGSVSIVGTNGATFYITGVQLEVGTSATSFEYRSYSTELQLCQRYFWQLGGSNSGNLSYYFPQPGNQPSGGGGMPMLFTNPVPMRVAPDSSFNLTSANYTTNTPSGTQWLLIAPNIDVCSFSGSTVQLFGAGSTTMAGAQLLYANISRQPSILVLGSTAWFRFNSEL